MGDGLADDHRPGCSQTLDDGRVEGGNEALHGLRAGLGWSIRRVEKVLDGDGDAVQRAAPPARGELTISIPGGVERMLSIHMGVRTNAGPGFRDAPKGRLREVPCR